MYQVLSSYSFEELVEYVKKSQYKLTTPSIDLYASYEDRNYSILQSKFSKNKIILVRPYIMRWHRMQQRNFVIKMKKQERGTLLEGRFVIPTFDLVTCTFFALVWLSICVLGLFGKFSLDLSKKLILVAACCIGCLVVVIRLFGGRFIYRQGEKEVLKYFRSLGTEIKPEGHSRTKHNKQ